MVIVYVFTRVFCLIRCFLAVAYFFLIYSISKFSKVDKCLLFERKACLSRFINELLVFLVPLSRSSTNKRSPSSRYLRLDIYISRLIKISSAIDITSYLLISFLSIFKLIIISNYYKLLTICG